MRSTCLGLMAIAGAATVSLAQVNDAPWPVVDGRTNPNMSINNRVHNYQGRVLGHYPVYDVGEQVTGVAATGTFNTSGFHGGIEGGINLLNPTNLDLTIDQVKAGIWAISNTADHLWLKIEYFPTFTVTAAGTCPGSGVPLSQIIDMGTGWAPGGVALGFGQFFPDGITLAATEQVTLPYAYSTVPGQWAVRMSVWADAAATVCADGADAMSRGGFTCQPVGTIQGSQRYFDNAACAADCGSATGSTTSVRSLYFGAWAQRDATLPTANNALGTIADGNHPVNDTLSSNVRWTSFTIANDALDTDYRYLDIDDEGSAVNGTIGLFDANGFLVWQDDASGSGTSAAQLSFGMGRRAAVADGSQYDGRNYYTNPTTFATSPGLPAGTYWIAYAGEGAVMGDGFVVSCAPAASGAYTLHIHNGQSVSGTTTLEPSVAPVVEEDLGTPVSPGAPIPSVALGAYQVRWFSFTTCKDTNASDTVVLDMIGSDDLETHAQALFDSAGNLVAQSEGASTQTITFNDVTVLPAGLYYLAHTWGGGTMEFSPDPTGHGRWHLRDTNGSDGFADAGTVNISWSDCGLDVCCRNDYNGDGDVGTDADIEAFFACLAGNCCATCPSNADYNCDGDTGTDADIESFFRVLAGGAC